jgi:hypoxanthine phosphoribosyltransferase
MTINIGRVVVDEAELQQRIRDLGKEITNDYVEDPPLLVGILKGAFMFMADLARAIDLPVEFDFMAVSSYGSATRTSGVVRIVKDLDLDLTDRHVLIVEDIVDWPHAAYLRKNLKARNPPLEVCACS